MCVLDDDEERRLRRALREQLERAEGDQEGIGGRGLVQAERSPQRCSLTLRQRVHSVEHGPQELVKAGERQPGLGLDRGRAQNGPALVGGVTAGLGEERRLADAGLTAENECPAAVADAFEPLVEHVQLALPSHQRLDRRHPQDVLPYVNEITDVIPSATRLAPPAYSEDVLEAERAQELLRLERERIEKALAALAESRDSELSTKDQHLGDEAMALYDDELAAGLREQLAEELADVERAEKRLAAGTYGLSIESGEPIPDERLEAIPTAERTAEEQARLER
jgi:DnaK suppressor protein